MKEKDERGKTGKPAIVYDIKCPVCSATMQWVRDHSEKDTFDMVGCGTDAARDRFPHISEAECMQAMQLVLPGGAVMPGEKALPEILRRLRHRRYRLAAGIFKLPGTNGLSRAVYRWFAGHRYQIARALFSSKREGK